MNFYINDKHLVEFLSGYEPTRISQCRNHKWEQFQFIEIDLDQQEFFILKLKFDIRTKENMWPEGWLNDTTWRE